MTVTRLTKDILPKGKSSLNPGEVALVGAGPGDAELLTIRAVRFIEQANIVIYDRLVSDEILELLPESCERLYVGKELNNHSVSQENINQTLIEQAQLGKRVLRLKGGDPFIFGRGSEEAEQLLLKGVSCHICPGITAASGATAYSGIPLTHRGIAQSCTFITGHIQNNGQLNLPWSNLSCDTQTVVFYMGINNLPTIANELINHGRDANTPAAIICNGTHSKQQVYRGHIDTLIELVELHNIRPPALIVIGNVVNQLSEEQLATPGFLDAKQYINASNVSVKTA